MKPYCIGITGGIGTGKSSVTNYVATQYHEPTIDLDKVAHQLYNTDKVLVESIISTFGESIRGPQGIDRKALGNLVFGDSQEAKSRKQQLENLVWPAVSQEYFSWKNSQTGLCFAEMSILYEANWEEKVDGIWLVYCDNAIRIERLMKRNNLSRQEAQKRIDSQLSQEEKIRRTIERHGKIIDNSGTLEELHAKVDFHYAKLPK